MSDMISRRQIHDYIQSQINPYGKPFEGTAYEFGLKIMDYIKNMSTVEPARGEWIAQDEGLTRFMCSHCESKNHDGSGNFCPRCGADMRGEKNEKG